MPRNPEAPRASEMHWLSEEEKQFALSQIPEGESFSDFARRKLFKLPALPSRGRPKPENKMSKKEQIAQLEAQAAINDRYADAAEKTYADTGRTSALNAAATNRAAAAQKRARAERLQNEAEEA
mgnify:CR=1 FL=1